MFHRSCSLLPAFIADLRSGCAWVVRPCLRGGRRLLCGQRQHDHASVTAPGGLVRRRALYAPPLVFDGTNSPASASASTSAITGHRDRLFTTQQIPTFSTSTAASAMTISGTPERPGYPAQRPSWPAAALRPVLPRSSRS